MESIAYKVIITFYWDFLIDFIFEPFFSKIFNTFSTCSSSSHLFGINKVYFDANILFDKLLVDILLGLRPYLYIGLSLLVHLLIS